MKKTFFFLGKQAAVLHIKQAQKSSKRDLPTKMGRVGAGHFFGPKNKDFILLK